MAAAPFEVMTAVQALLLGVGAILALGALGEVLFRRTGIPDVIWLVIAGAALGPIGGVLSRDDLGAIAPYLAAFTLVMIMFQGGVSIRIRDLVHSSPRSTAIALLGYLTTVAVIGGAGALAVRAGVAPRGWTTLHGVLLGAILGGSSSIIVVPALLSARVRPVLRDLLTVESTLTDILCVVVTAVLVDVMLGHAPSGGTTAVRVAASFGIALGIGAAAGVLGVVLLRLVGSREHLYPLTLAALLGLYALVDHAGGSGALAIVVAAVILGNASDLESHLGMRDPHDLDPGIRGFHQQMTFLIKTFFFVFLGAMLGPPWRMAWLGVIVGLLLFAARIPSVYLGTFGGPLTTRERRLATVALPRGLAAGVLAVLPAAAGVPGTEDLPVIVYAAVATTIVIFAVGFRIAERTPEPAPAPA